ncbi:hypothetical protein TraAM80_00635 [Trypanosoma rangeli]|uniref:Uncharacterized protein n=1 Tax=Trypanosoma rangeli TaxID=5698 RepID=A0A3R7N2U6_TRYRA|nr:uncharacterized protein TraAM80_00635 [Trypanosoma rangeli]RNF11940.1 hypothetical protein TraAM80_00635 [Trypanosoma rangeli]|eukprot:RNF11940.1 hypothetical protein TraAM80_00635 [Trypanosoma rangeli]
MQHGRRRFHSVTSAPQFVTLGRAPLLWARRGAGSPTSGPRQSHVTPFFAALFSTCYTEDDLADDVTSRRVAFVQHALCAKGRPVAGGTTVTGGKWPATAPSTFLSLRPWHVIANLKHAVLFAMNEEEKSQRHKVGETGRDDIGRRQYDGDESTSLRKGIREDKGANCRGGERHVAPSEIARLVRQSMRAVQQQSTRAMADAMMTEAKTLHDASQLQEMEDKLQWERESLRNGPQKAAKEALMSYVLGGGDELSGEARSTLEPLRLVLKETMRSSAYAFHLAFETLLRQGQDYMAVELFRRWWRHNPHLFPIELGPNLENEVVSMLEDIRAEGDVSPLQWSMIARLLAQIPYKKYMVSSPLFTRVLKVALCLGIPALEDEFVLKELIYQGVYVACCGSRAGNMDGSGHNTEPSTCRNDLYFHVYQEKYEDWLVLIGAMAAAAVLERHAEAFLREQGGGARYDRFVRSVRDEYTAFIQRASCPQLIYSTQASLTATTKQDGETSKPSAVPGWSKLLFTTVLRCYEEAGVFHASPVRRPGNTAALWRQIHTRLIQQFPHVFHAGNTVTTLLSFAALEEAAVSSLGTRRLTFYGKEEALCRWRLECLSERETQGSGSSIHNEFVWPQAVSDIPRASRRLRARLVTAHSVRLNGVAREVSADANPSTDAEVHAQQKQLHWKHRELFGHALSLSVSQHSIPVFVTSEEVKSYAADAIDEIEAARLNIVEIFREHTSLLMLRPASSLDELSSQERRSCGGILAEASQPSMYLFLRLVSLLSSFGESPVSAAEAVDNVGESRSFPLLTCIEEDILPYCHPSVAIFLRRCCTTYLSRSGTRGIEALVGGHQTFLEQLTEEAAVERLLFGVLWGGGRGKRETGSSNHYSFGSGSLAWQVIAQHRSVIFRTDGRSLLEMVLSHLTTLSLTIPDDYRRIVCVSSHMHRVVADLMDSASTALSALRNELEWNPASARHIYISLLELLSWVIDKNSRKKVGEGAMNGMCEGCTDEVGDEDASEEDSGANLPTLVDTARHWRVVQRCFRMQASALKVFPPSLLERICLILVHSCPDVELIVTCLLALCQQSRGESRSGGESLSFITPRLLTSLCCLLVMNGLGRSSVLKWREQNGAPSSSLSPSCVVGGGADANALSEWHLMRLEHLMPSANQHQKEERAVPDRCTAGYHDGGDDSAVGTNEAAHLLGSIVLDVLLSDAHWIPLRNAQYYVFIFTSAAESLPREGTDAATVHGNKSSFPLGVVLPSRQMSFSHPTGVRQRVTNLKDALREMGALRRLQLRSSMSPVQRREKGVLEAYRLTDDDDNDAEGEEEVVNFFLRCGADEFGVTTPHPST